MALAQSTPRRMILAMSTSSRGWPARVAIARATSDGRTMKLGEPLAVMTMSAAARADSSRSNGTASPPRLSARLAARSKVRLVTVTRAMPTS